MKMTGTWVRRGSTIELLDGDPPTRSIREFAFEDELETGPRSPAMIEYDGVFEGGGAKGGAFVGALAFMEKHGRWFKRVAGTSAGAITAALVASGYRARGEPSSTYQKPQESLEDVVFKTDFTKFLDSPNPATFSDKEIERSLMFKVMNEALPAMLAAASPIMAPGSQAWKLLPTSLKIRALRELLTRSPELAISGFKLSLPVLFSLLERGGLYAGQEFYQKLNDNIRKGLQQHSPGASVSREPTFAELFKRTGISLNLVASDIGRGRMLVMNEVLNPDMPVAKAVRMSMSIPFIFTAVVNDFGCAVVDGGILSNYPMFLFRRNNSFVRNSPADLKRKNIGFLLDERSASPTGPSSQRCPATEFSPVDFSGKLLGTMMEAFDRRVTGDFTIDTVRINVEGYSTIQFQMTPDQKHALANRGWAAAARFFQKRGEIPAPAPSPYAGGPHREFEAEWESQEAEADEAEFEAEECGADLVHYDRSRHFRPASRMG